MSARKSYIFILLAYGLALVHSAIPHQHTSTTTSDLKFEVPNVYDASILGRLQAAFATDLGSGHLESFAKSEPGADVAQSASDVPVVFLACLHFSAQPRAEAHEGFGDFIEKLHSRTLLLASRQFRAPPVFS